MQIAGGDNRLRHNKWSQTVFS